ncbi:MAG TPA: zinc ribbon domain-containing protein [Verrucomicrobiae bacterium]|nr:zinc ribbon domain-containing protein [Verrucomicrobiae bacterium]
MNKFWQDLSNGQWSSNNQLQWLAAEIQEIQQEQGNLNRNVDPATYALRLQNAILLGTKLAIFPITIAKAAADTLIFAMILLFCRNLTFLFRSNYRKMPDLGLMMSLGLTTIVVAIAYHSYQGIAYPFLFPDNYAIYGWVFLVLVLAPLIFLTVVVARNMDAITGAVMQSGSVLAAPPPPLVTAQCSNCGQPVPAGTKFCPNCGTAANAVRPNAAARSVCLSCGAENPSSAKFCKQCGQSVQ